MIAPVSAWVVEMGSPAKVATITAPAAPPATAKRNAGAIATLARTTPLPVKVLIRPAAITSALMLPAKVAAVAIPIATR
jgi:hypothetical protein